MTSNKAAQVIVNAFRQGNKCLIVGNGGSAAMSSHLAGEFLGHFTKERQPLPAISLTDPAVITAIANDYSFAHIFSRQIEALGRAGDILIVFTTSDIYKSDTPHSLNIRNGITTAKLNGMEIIESPRIGSSTGGIQEFQLHWLHDLVRNIETSYL